MEVTLFFSIIMPVYNAAAYLKNTVDSVLGQDFQDFELIAVDDGSTDGSAGILRELALRDGRVRPLTKPNGGPASARNAGLAAARGEYVLFLDADDGYEPGALGALYAELAKPADVLTFGYRYVYPGKEKNRDVASPRPIEFASRKAVEEGALQLMEARLLFPSTWNKAYRRRLLMERELRLPTDLYVAEDLYFNLTVLEAAQSYRVIPGVFYRYIQQNAQSIMTRFKGDKFDQLMAAHELRSKLLKRYAPDPAGAEALGCMDLVRICFSCFMDLFGRDCPLARREKLAYIGGIREQAQPRSVDGRFLSRKERLILGLYRRLGRTGLYYFSWLLYQLKFRLGMGF